MSGKTTRLTAEKRQKRDWKETMARKAAIDYKKPFYICSFDADEIIFNMARGTSISMDKYDGSLPVSLDSLEIRRACGTKEFKEKFPEAFRTKRKKTFCDAVINVDFTGGKDFTDVEQIRKDHEDIFSRIENLKVEREDDGTEHFSIAPNITFIPPVMSDEIEITYREFLNTYHENQLCWKEEEGSGSKKALKKAECVTKLALDEPGMSLEKVTVSVTGTRIGVSAAVKKNNARAKDEDESKGGAAVRLYVCRYEKKKVKQKILGIFESEPAEPEPGKTKTLRLHFDIRDLVEKEDYEYLLDKGEYLLLAGGTEDYAPVAVLDLKEEIRQPNYSRSPEWLDETEWEKEEISDSKKIIRNQDIPVLSVSSKRQTTFKECGKLYDSILDKGCETAIDCIVEKHKNENSGNTQENPAQWVKDNVISLNFRMRYVLYEEGFDAVCGDGDERHFVAYKRSASKSKQGSCLFIWDKLYDHMINDRTWMGLPVARAYEQDLTSAKAYEALTLSSIIKEFSLDPESILLVDSKKGDKVEGNRRIVCKTGETEGEETVRLEIKTPEECRSCDNEACKEAALSYRNAVWDGQALLDESVFTEIFRQGGITEQHGMILLRNHFFKACAFNTRITEYYKRNGITTVYDMFGKKHRADKIRLIITPDSLKFLKFAPAFFGGETGEESPEEAAFKHWKQHIKNKKMPFGIVKKDENSKERYNVGYQILNTLPLGRAEMSELFKTEKEYIEELWTNDELFMQKVPKETAMGRFMTMMYERFPGDDGFVSTDQYISYKRRCINDIKKRIRRGRLKVDGDMYTLCSTPYEMLFYSGLDIKKREENIIKPLLKPDEAYIEGMVDGLQITLCRYPHMSSGSVCVLKQKSRPEFKKWFNLKNPEGGCNIVLVSPWESNIMVKLGGADFDSDTALFVKDSVFAEAAEKLLDPDGILKPLAGKYAPSSDGLPVAQAGDILKEGEKASENGESAFAFTLLDNKLAKTQTTVGSISNNIQLFNCYLWEALFAMQTGDGAVDEGYIEALYESILKLAVLNELEIDRSKHEIDLKTNHVMSAIMEAEYNGKPLIKATKKKRRSGYANQDEKDHKEKKILYQPAFLYEIKRDRGNLSIALRGTLKKDKYWNCPADQLALLVSELRKPREIVAKKEISYSMGKDSKEKAEARQVARIEELLKKTLTDLDRLDRRGHTTDDEMEKRERIQSDFVEEIVNLKNIREKTMDYVFRDTMCRKKGAEDEYWNKYMYMNRYRILGLLFMASDRLDEKLTEGNSGKVGDEQKENVIRRCMGKIEIIDA